MGKYALACIMPIYNEEGAISEAVEACRRTFDSLEIDYHIHLYNDGSVDNTLQVISELAKNNSRIVVHNNPNKGHGPTIIEGYRNAVDKYEWIFQIDSDNEISPDIFPDLWNCRDNYDFLVGSRNHSSRALTRKIISFISRLSVRIFYGKSIMDVNIPFRLMRAEKFKELFDKIPSDTFAPNVIVSGFAAKRKLRSREYPAPYRFRQTGEVSIKKLKLLKAALKSFRQTFNFSFICK